MRLLSMKDGKLCLATFTQEIPPYAILSHTWGSDDDEVTFEDITAEVCPDKAGMEKIRFCAEQAARDHLTYFWVDTCCINKKSSEELATAIRSMFRWYEQAERCYVYLSDVSADAEHVKDVETWESAFRGCRWFTRGWTLQELVAPSSVEFFSKESSRLGDKKSLAHIIEDVTRVPRAALQGKRLSSYSIGDRLSWADKRHTTKEEDLAYCLWGIFGVTMPPQYGEGRRSANRRLQREIRNLPQLDGTAPKPYAMIPFRRDTDFVDRGDFLAQIERRCFEPAGRVALTGLGGVGKSQLAIEVMHHIFEERAGTWVFWVFAETKSHVRQGFGSIANAVKMPGWNDAAADTMQLVCDWLQNLHQSEWVLVLDSADDRTVFFDDAHDVHDGVQDDARKPFASYLPQSHNGAIVVTSRDRDLAARLVGLHNVLDVGPMSQTDGLQLLENKLGSLPEDDAGLQAAGDLVQTLDNIPLAIVQAAALIHEQSSIAAYLADFRRSEQEQQALLAREAPDLRRYGGASNAISTTWQLSFDSLRTHHASAARLLSLMCFFDHNSIPGSALQLRPDAEHACDAADAATVTPDDDADDADRAAADYDKGDARSYAFMDDFSNRHWRRFSVPVPDEAANEAQLARDTDVLLRFWMVRASSAGDAFSMHHLVQVCTRSWLARYGTTDRWARVFLYDLDLAHEPALGRLEALGQQLAPHVDMALALEYGTSGSPEGQDQPSSHGQPSSHDQQIWADLMLRGGWHRVQYRHGQQTSGAALIQKALAWFEPHWGADHRKTHLAKCWLARYYVIQDHEEQACAVYQDVLDSRIRVLGWDHEATLQCAESLASSLSTVNRHAEAEQLYEKVLQSRTECLRQDAPETQKALEGPERPVNLDTEARRRISGVLQCQLYRAITRASRGDHVYAEQACKQIVARTRSLFGPHDFTLASTLTPLARLYNEQGRHAEAEQAGSEALRIFQALHSSNNQEVMLYALCEVAGAQHGLGRQAEAMATLADCAAQRETYYGKEHPVVVETYDTLREWQAEEAPHKKSRRRESSDEELPTKKTKLDE